MRFVFKSASAVTESIKSMRSDQNEIERLTNAIHNLRKGDENQQQRRAITQFTNRLNKIKNRQDESWKLYQLHLEGLTGDNGLLQQQQDALTAFAENLARRTLSATFVGGRGGRVTRALTDEQVSRRELRDLRTRLPRERTFLRRLGRAEDETRDVTMAEQRVADRSERQAKAVEKRIKRLQRGEEDKDQKNKIKNLQNELADIRRTGSEAQKRADTSRAGLKNIRDRMKTG